jgi:NADH-quinone oxidoreductase subunit K
MIVPYYHVLLFAGILFGLGVICTLTRRNLIMILLGLEIMLNAGALAFIASGLDAGQIEGQAVVIFVLAVAAAEVSLGLALITTIYRQTGTTDPRCIESDTCELE